METFKYEDKIVEYNIDDLVIWRDQAEIIFPMDELLSTLGSVVAFRLNTKVDGEFVQMQSLMKDEIYDGFANDKKGRIELIEFVIAEAYINFS